MSFKITKNDYIKILQYYNLSVPKKLSDIKKSAEKILSEKLCKCIKKVSPTNEPLAIGVCSKNIFGRKGLTRGKFTCKNKRSVMFKKTRKNLTIKNKKA
uniref:Uncharacterized protein n=1 Tax=viral metagenome TaxID=1070528 RepID=A0A6C0DGL5_9ZZZZ